MQITENIHLIQLGGNNLYLITSRGESLLIDSYVAGGETQVFEAIEGEGVDPKTLGMVLITHGHLDHIGGNFPLKQKTPAKFAAHIADAGMIEDIWLQFLETVCRFRSPTEERYKSFANTTGKGVQVDILLRDGDMVKVGDYELEVVHTPGHSPGSLCLYNRRQKALFTGDTFYFLTGWLGLIVDAVSYWNSINKVAGMDIELFLPAHGQIRKGADAKRDIYGSIDGFREAESRILEILVSHDGLRLDQIKDLAAEKVLGTKREDDLDQELYTTNAFLQKLCYEGKAKQHRGLIWTTDHD